MSYAYQGAMLNEALKLLDPYTLRARLMPALLAGLPIATSIVAWFPERIAVLGVIRGLVVLLGGTTLLSQVARDCGKKLEPELLKEWGGMPSVTILGHRDAHLNPETKARYYRNLRKLIPGIKFPTPESEAADHAAADLIYSSCSDFLRESTRNPETYGLLLSENINYGTRRNLLGLKPWAILFASVGIIASATAIIHALASSTDWVVPGTSCLIALTCLVWWSLRVNKAWVKMMAFAYAERQLAACDQLEPK